MTIDERIERLEFQNTAYVEQRRKDWEEYLIRERDLKSHIDAIWLRMERRDEEYEKYRRELAEQMKEHSRETDERMEKLSRETDERLAKLGHETDKRIQDLVVAIGQFISKAS